MLSRCRIAAMARGRSKARAPRGPLIRWPNPKRLVLNENSRVVTLALTNNSQSTSSSKGSSDTTHGGGHKDNP